MTERLFSEFKDPPKEYSVLPFWFINKFAPKEEFSRQVREMIDKGVYGFFIHARRGLEVPDPVKAPKKPRLGQWLGILSLILTEARWFQYFTEERKKKRIPYLTDEWWQIVSDILVEGKKHDMELGIYDEFDWPSGTAGMMVPQEPKFRAKYLTPSGEVIEDENYVDVMNPDATDEFIRVTHEEYRDRYGELFGELIKYFFSDEVTLLHHLKYFSPIGLAPWSDRLEEEFRKDHGYSTKGSLGLLWKEGEGCERFRCDFWTTVSRLYSENFHGRIKRWCERHGIVYTGHVFPEEVGPLQIRCQANIFDALRKMHLPGIDHLTNKIGGCLPRIPSSIAHYLGSKRVLCESFGASGRGLRLGDMRKIANWLFVNGVNLINPHAFYLSTEGFREYDCPPSQFFQASYWDDYRKFSDYIRRASYILSQGEHDPDVAVYYPVLSFFANHDLKLFNGTVNTIASELESLHVLLGMIHKDYDFLDDEMLLKSKTQGEKLYLRNESYSALIVPCATTLSSGVLKKIGEAMKGGVKVVFTTWLPFKCFDGADAEEWSRGLFRLDPKDVFKKKLKIWLPWLPLFQNLPWSFEYILMRFPLLSFTRVFEGKHGSSFLFTTSGLSTRENNAEILEEILGEQQDPKIEGKNVKFLRIFRRKVGGGKIYFISNISKDRVEARIDFGRDAQVLDFANGEIKKCPKEIDFPPFEARGFYA